MAFHGTVDASGAYFGLETGHASGGTHSVHVDDEMANSCEREIHFWDFRKCRTELARSVLTRDAHCFANTG